ncbi:hypothetical protein LX36DRAFT_714574 [Colletotrichum falcatum]|nr:hypothetical protein LX36DRAFT_714574 [Colletotrichum falcatum]
MPKRHLSEIREGFRAALAQTLLEPAFTSLASLEIMLSDSGPENELAHPESYVGDGGDDDLSHGLAKVSGLPATAGGCLTIITNPDYEEADIEDTTTSEEDVEEDPGDAGLRTYRRLFPKVPGHGQLGLAVEAVQWKVATQIRVAMEDGAGGGNIKASTPEGEMELE